MAKYTNPEDFEGTFWTVLDADFYVSPTGNDVSGDGSPKKPFLTIERAFEEAIAGERIIVGPEEYLRVQVGSDGANGGTEIPCRLATTSNINLESGGLFEIDGVLVEAGDRVLVWHQNIPSENGAYVASANVWERANDFNSPDNIRPGKLIAVIEGTENNQTIFQFITYEDIVVGITDLMFTQAAISDWGQIQGDILDQADLSSALDSKADDIALTTHISDISNPHKVTKAQVDLGNVDDTSDIDKPISLLQQNLFDEKTSVTQLAAAIDSLKDGVPADGDTLNKLYGLVQNIVGVSASANDIASRDLQQAELENQQNIYVADASADDSVDSGWAIYKYLQPTDSFIKISEQESIDLVLNAVSTIAGYDNVLFVRESGDDATAQFGELAKPYATPSVASQAARADFDLNGNKNLVYVLKGTYNDKDIIANHVDLEAQDGVVIYATGDSDSVINDRLEIMDDVTVFGKGTYLHQFNNPGVDSEGVNVRRASKFSVSAKVIDSLQVWGSAETEFTLSNCIYLIPKLSHHQNKTINFNNCKFLNGLRSGSYIGQGTEVNFNDCEFIVPEFVTTDANNTSLDIYDYNNNLILRISPSTTTVNPIDTTLEADLDAVIARVDAEHTNGNNVSTAECMGFMFSQNTGFSIANLKVNHLNSIIRIKRDKCMGILLCQKRDSLADGPPSVTFSNVRIFDESPNKDTVALVTGWGVSATVQPYFMLSGVSHDCAVERKLLNASYNPWLKTFNEIDETTMVSDVEGLQSELDLKADSSELTIAVDNLKEGVPIDGDSLNKLYDLIQNKLGVSASATDIADRDAQQASLEDQQNIYVADASGDATVTSGWAIYKYLGSTDSFIKITEQESLDVALLKSGNGITLNDNRIDLGGALEQNTIITGQSTYGVDFGTSASKLSRFFVYSDVVWLEDNNAGGVFLNSNGGGIYLNDGTRSTDSSSLGIGISSGRRNSHDGSSVFLSVSSVAISHVSGIEIDLGNITLRQKDSNSGYIDIYADNEIYLRNNVFELKLESDGMCLVDNSISKKGLEYAEDYSTSFVERSLVDKAYVDVRSAHIEYPKFEKNGSNEWYFNDVGAFSLVLSALVETGALKFSRRVQGTPWDDNSGALYTEAEINTWGAVQAAGIGWELLAILDGTEDFSNSDIISCKIEIIAI